MKRRSFIQLSALSVALPAVPALAQAKSQPNLLIIETDEHNLRTLSCYRNTMSKEQGEIWGKDVVVDTPNIDWLAKNGALCTRFYATIPVCSPSRGCMVSGRYGQNTPVVGNNIPLNDEIITFAEILKRQGYATGYVGKWHLDGGGKPQWAPKRKFGFEDNRFMFNRGHWKKFGDTKDGPKVTALNDKGKPTYGVNGADEKSFATDWLTNKTIDFINTNKNKPWCHMLSLPDPHGPNSVRPPYDTMYDNLKFEAPMSFNKSDENLPSWGKKAIKKFNGSSHGKYFGMVRCIDDNVGRIFDTLRKNNILENTVVIFTSDHGDLLGEHAKNNKGVPYEMSARVAFLLYYKPKVKPGTVVEQALSMVDLLPTVINLMGHKTAGKEDGRNASGLFVGDKKVIKNWDDINFIRSTGNPGTWLAATSNRFKLIYSPFANPWLFDLKNDPNELVNEFSNKKHRETIRSMSKKLVAYCKTYKDPIFTNAKLKTDIEWGANGKGTFTPREITPSDKKKKKRNN